MDREAQSVRDDSSTADPFQIGVLVGLLIGEGHLGTNNKQPYGAVKMHERHMDIFFRLVDMVPGSRLYGPSHHDGRHYFLWVARSNVIRDSLLPLLEAFPWKRIAPEIHARYERMKQRHGLE